MNKFQNILCFLAVLAFGMLGTGCSTEDSQVEVPEPKGILCLKMSSDEVYIQTGTRAVQTLTDWSEYQFTLDNGTTSTPLVFTDGKAIIEAGTYTLSATNAASVDNGYAGPLYSGSKSVTIEAGKQTDVTLDLGKPKNAKVTLALSEAVSSKYYHGNGMSLAGKHLSSLSNAHYRNRFRRFYASIFGKNRFFPVLYRSELRSNG
mgnify:CR=1 FL=1